MFPNDLAESIDGETVRWMQEVAKTKQIQKLRGKQAFVKPSVERRDEVRKATYVQSLKTQAEKES